MLLTYQLTDADAVEIKLANGKTERFRTDDDFSQKTVKLKAKYRGYRGSKNRQLLVIENRE